MLGAAAAGNQLWWNPRGPLDCCDLEPGEGSCVIQVFRSTLQRTVSLQSIISEVLKAVNFLSKCSDGEMEANELNLRQGPESDRDSWLSVSQRTRIQIRLDPREFWGPLLSASPTSERVCVFCRMWSVDAKLLFIPRLKRTKCFGSNSLTSDLPCEKIQSSKSRTGEELWGVSQAWALTSINHFFNKNPKII